MTAKDDCFIYIFYYYFSEKKTDISDYSHEMSVLYFYLFIDMMRVSTFSYSPIANLPCGTLFSQKNNNKEKFVLYGHVNILKYFIEYWRSYMQLTYRSMFAYM